MYEVKFNTVTPLWTGDSKRKGDTVRETGIIGSLRWWYEILVRGLGGHACDPTDTSCNSDKYCDACSLFGCTGHSRKFKLEVVMPERRKDRTSSEYPVVEVRNSRKKPLTRRVSGIMSKDNSVTLKFIPLRKIEDQEWLLLNETIKLIDRYGALGGRTAQGNGVIKVVENDLDRLVSEHNVRIPVFTGPAASFEYLKCKEFYNLRDFVSLRYAFKFDESKDNLRNTSDIDVLPIASQHVRRVLRSSAIRRDLFGQKGRGSRVFVSHGYINEHSDNTMQIRIFAFVTGGEKARKEFCQQIESTLVGDPGNFLFRSSQGKEEVPVKVELLEMVYGEQIIANMRKGGDR